MKQQKHSILKVVLACVLYFTFSNVVVGQVSGTTCLAASGGSGCSAGDLSVSNITVLRVIEGCVSPSDTALLDLSADVVSASAQRYDAGIWINEDGTDAILGSQCFRDFLPTSELFPNLDGDICGEVVSNTTETKILSGVSIACADLDGDTMAEVSTCVSWKNQSRSNDCSGVLDTDPGTSSKCQCGLTQVDEVPIPDISLTKSCTPDDIEPGGTISCTITINNATGAGVATNLHFEDDYPQTYGSISNLATTAGATVSDNGDIIDIQTGDIAAGTTITITYDFDVNTADNLPNGTSMDSFTNTVEAYYTNTDGVATAQGLAQSDTTTVPITVGYFETRRISSRVGGSLIVEWQTQSETANIGFNLPPRSSAAPRKGAVSAAISPAHLVTDATVAGPIEVAMLRASSGSNPSSAHSASKSAPTISRAK